LEYLLFLKHNLNINVSFIVIYVMGTNNRV
jgi:hypothetical protein